MEKIKKYKIEFEKSLFFIKNNLNNLNTLSNAVLNHTPFSDGTFYTFLKKDLSENMVSEFKYGGVGGGARSKINEIITKEIYSDSDTICIFDAFNHDYDPNDQWDLFDEVGVHLDKEIYFLFTQKKVSPLLLTEAFNASNCTWHSLIVLTRGLLYKNETSSISENTIEMMAKLAQHVFFLAYDGEGYIIWQKNHIKNS